MNIKKETIANVNAHIKNNIDGINFKIRQNKNKMRDLIKEQTLLKRTRAELDKLRRTLPQL